MTCTATACATPTADGIHLCDPHEGEAFAAMERIGNARAAVLQGAFTADTGAEGWGDWTFEGYNI